MMKKAAALGLVFSLLGGPMFANEGAVPKGIPPLDHVFVIMMENHAYGQIVDNPDAPFTNKYAKSANAANNYFAIAHPSLTNYLEVIGGSNFGILNDNSPDWHVTTLHHKSRLRNALLRCLNEPQCLPHLGHGNGCGNACIRPHERNHAPVHYFRNQHRRRSVHPGRQKHGW
jgi:hypothetical protein